jgi:hypothetical protein
MTDIINRDETSVTLRRVLLSDIDFAERYFKISRDRVSDELRSSIRDFGVLDPPVVLDEGGRYRVLFGFNRLDVLSELGAGSADVFVLPRVDAKSFCARALLKCFRNESGPIGRTRIIAILKDLGTGSDTLARIAKNGLHVPAELAFDGALSAAILELPDAVKEYLDHRDLPFRIIKDLVRLPRTAIDAFSLWLAFAPLRVNIFRFIIDMLSDIQMRDGTLDFAERIRPDESIDRKQWEEHLYKTVRGMRYPEHSSIKKRADEIAGYFSARGIQVDYPPFFEGDGVDLTVRLHKREDPGSVRRKIDDADLSILKELLEML